MAAVPDAAVLCLMLLVTTLDQWDHQRLVQRVNESLLSRGYLTWFDLTNMKGEIIWSLWVVHFDVLTVSCNGIGTPQAVRWMP